jgi:hypothetical protein
MFDGRLGAHVEGAQADSTMKRNVNPSQALKVVGSMGDHRACAMGSGGGSGEKSRWDCASAQVTHV